MKLHGNNVQPRLIGGERTRTWHVRLNTYVCIRTCIVRTKLIPVLLAPVNSTVPRPSLGVRCGNTRYDDYKQPHGPPRSINVDVYMVTQDQIYRSRSEQGKGDLDGMGWLLDAISYDTSYKMYAA